MYQVAEMEQNNLIMSHDCLISAGFPVVQRLDQSHEAEALEFLACRSDHTFAMIGLIRSNGMDSPFNKGNFYACRGEQGCLEGIALIGHNMLFEARKDWAISAFAQVARDCSRPHLILGQERQVERFWASYTRSDQVACSSYIYKLMAQRVPVAKFAPMPGLRLATLDDLDQVLAAHAESGLEETGIDQLKIDLEGFRRRCIRRIQLQQTWVCFEDEKLVFKVETLSETPEVIYLESLWVDPAVRRRGYGIRCISQLGSHLLQRTASLCLLVKDINRQAQAFYEKAGYEFVSNYRAIFLYESSDDTSKQKTVI